MTSVWIWRITEYDESAGASSRDPLAGVDPSGFDVHASDGYIGKVDEATNEAGRGLLVVDTGFWIFGKKRMIPTSSVESVKRAQRVVVLSVSKDQVKDAPDYEQARRDEDQYRDDVERHFH